MRKLVVVLVWTLLVAGTGCGKKSENPVSAPASSAKRFEGLGPHRRAVSTSVPDAQAFFDQGLAFLFAFNHDEAIRAFEEAARLDPGCAMAQWGIAVARGPHINNPAVSDDAAKAAFAAAAAARAKAAAGGPVERALIEAVAARWSDPPAADRKALDQAYADAMAQVWQRYPQDADVGALYAEALMDLHPWDLYLMDGSEQPWTAQIVATLEAVLAAAPEHPLANHLYIHAVEASSHPERADAAADRLRQLAPALGHLVHMPSHIDVRRGRWVESIRANELGMEADRKYLEKTDVKPGFYRIYMAHNHHMLAYSAMMSGRSQDALRAIDAMVAQIPEDWLKENALFADGFIAMPLEVRMRFGLWDQILAAPDLPEYLPIARTLRHYARGVAFAAQGKIAEAKGELAEFQKAKAKVGAEAIFGNNMANDLIAVAEHTLLGEIAAKDGRLSEGVAELRKAAELEDKLRYDEPPDWIQPIRHALGATLLAAGRAADAEAVYRQDLARIPDNGWSLFGLARSLRLQKKDAEAEALEARFGEVWKLADVTIGSSCYCQPGS